MCVLYLCTRLLHAVRQKAVGCGCNTGVQKGGSRTASCELAACLRKRVWPGLQQPSLRLGTLTATNSVCFVAQMYRPEVLEILDRAAAGDDSVCYRIDGVVKADLFGP